MKRQTLIITVLAVLTAGAALAVNYKTSNYEARGGSSWVIGGTLDVTSGGNIDIENGADLDIESGGDVDVEAGGDVDVVGDINIKLDGDLDVENGGDLTVDSGGALTASSGSTVNIAGTFKIGGTTVSPSAAEINTLDAVYSSASTAVTDGSETANAHNLSLTVKDADSGTLATAGCANAYYSSTSVIPTGATPSAVTATTGSIIALGTGIYNVCWDSAGAFVANFYEDGGDADRWLALVLPTGKLLFSAKMDFD